CPRDRDRHAYRDRRGIVVRNRERGLAPHRPRVLRGNLPLRLGSRSHPGTATPRAQPPRHGLDFRRLRYRRGVDPPPPGVMKLLSLRAITFKVAKSSSSIEL